LAANDVARFFANHVVGSKIKRCRMFAEAHAHGITGLVARRFVDRFIAAWEDAACYNTDVEYQRQYLRAALGDASRERDDMDDLLRATSSTLLPPQPLG
jgi:hypothetical protein